MTTVGTTTASYADEGRAIRIPRLQSSRRRARRADCQENALTRTAMNAGSHEVAFCEIEFHEVTLAPPRSDSMKLLPRRLKSGSLSEAHCVLRRLYRLALKKERSDSRKPTKLGLQAWYECADAFR